MLSYITSLPSRIRLFLCKRNYIELSSAIYLADKVSAVSKAFAEATFPGLELIIKGNGAKKNCLCPYHVSNLICASLRKQT